MSDDVNSLSLATLGFGAAEEKFQDALHEIVKNIADPNTSKTAVRAITINITFKIDENRDIKESMFNIKSSLAPLKSIPLKAYMARLDGKLTLAEQRIPGQVSLFDKIPGDKILTLGDRG